jgi:hypothetical protein
MFEGHPRHPRVQQLLLRRAIREISLRRPGEVTTEEHRYFMAEIMQLYMEEIMKCPHLKLWLVATCKINEKAYVPSAFQLHEYCKTKGHKRCPFFAKSFSQKKQVDDRTRLLEYA